MGTSTEIPKGDCMDQKLVSRMRTIIKNESSFHDVVTIEHLK